MYGLARRSLPGAPQCPKPSPPIYPLFWDRMIEAMILRTLEVLGASLADEFTCIFFLQAFQTQHEVHYSSAMFQALWPPGRIAGPQRGSPNSKAPTPKGWPVLRPKNLETRRAFEKVSTSLVEQPPSRVRLREQEPWYDSSLVPLLYGVIFRLDTTKKSSSTKWPWLWALCLNDEALISIGSKV